MGDLGMWNWRKEREVGEVGARRRSRGCLIERAKARVGVDGFGGVVRGSAGRKSGRAWLACWAKGEEWMAVVGPALVLFSSENEEAGKNNEGCELTTQEGKATCHFLQPFFSCFFLDSLSFGFAFGWSSGMGILLKWIVRLFGGVYLFLSFDLSLSESSRIIRLGPFCAGDVIVS